jgi:hypothetical protein
VLSNWECLALWPRCAPTCQLFRESWRCISEQLADLLTGRSSRGSALSTTRVRRSHENSYCFDSRNEQSQSTAAIGRILIAEGHEVVGLSGSTLRNRIEDFGAEFRLPVSWGLSGPTSILKRDGSLTSLSPPCVPALIPTAMNSSNQMPWQPVGRMGNEELRAVYEYPTQAEL